MKPVHKGDLLFVHNCFGCRSHQGPPSGERVEVQEGDAVFLGEISTHGWWKSGSADAIRRRGGKCGIKLLTKQGIIWTLAGSTNLSESQIGTLFNDPEIKDVQVSKSG